MPLTLNATALPMRSSVGAAASARPSALPATLLLCASLLGSTSAFAVDWQTPQYGDDRIDVQNYNLAVDIQPSLTAIAGVVTMQVRPTVATRDFTLDLHALKVSAVTVGGLKAAYTQTGDKLRITPATGLRQNQVVTVQVTYAGSPSGQDSTNIPIWEVNAARRTLHFGQNYSLSPNVFPCNQVSTDKATYSFAITVPKGLVAVAPGLPQPAKPAGIGKTTYPFLLAQEISPQDVSLTVGPFRVDTATLASGLRLDLYSMADVTNAPAVMETFRRTMEASERLWGAYRFPSTTAIVSGQFNDITQLLWATGANVSWINVNADDEYYHSVEESFIQPISRHFLLTNPARLSEFWFKDGLEQYALKRIRNLDVINEVGVLRWNHYLEYGSPNLPSLVDADCVTGFSVWQVAYFRGDLMMADLEYRVGRPMVDKILRSWAALQQTRPVTTTDFVTNAALISKDPGVVNLLNNWIYNDPLPTPAFITGPTAAN